MTRRSLTGPGRTIDLGTITLNGGASGFISIDGSSGTGTTR